MFRKYILPRIVYVFYYLLSKSWRVHLIEPESLKQQLKNKKPCIFAIWHGDELVMISLTKRYRVCTLTSVSKDGELMDYVIKKMGMKTARGSSSKKAISGLKALLRLAKDNYTPVFAVDGPRGPYHQIKPGVFEVAKLLKLDIYAAGVAVKRKLVFKKSWNKAYLPGFFAKVVIVWSEALSLGEIKDPRDPALATKLEQKFNAASRKASDYLAAQNPH